MKPEVRVEPGKVIVYSDAPKNPVITVTWGKVGWSVSVNDDSAQRTRRLESKP